MPLVDNIHRFLWWPRHWWTSFGGTGGRSSVPPELPKKNAAKVIGIILNFLWTKNLTLCFDKIPPEFEAVGFRNFCFFFYIFIIIFSPFYASCFSCQHVTSTAMFAGVFIHRRWIFSPPWAGRPGRLSLAKIGAAEFRVDMDGIGGTNNWSNYYHS